MHVRTAIARCPGILFRSAIAGSIVATAMMRDYTGKDIDGECH
jgi:hypothetical protein